MFQNGTCFRMERESVSKTFRTALPASAVGNIGLHGESGEQDPDGGSQHAVESEGCENGEDCVDGHGPEESLLHKSSFCHAAGRDRVA